MLQISGLANRITCFRTWENCVLWYCEFCCSSLLFREVNQQEKLDTEIFCCQRLSVSDVAKTGLTENVDVPSAVCRSNRGTSDLGLNFLHLISRTWPP